MTCLDNIQIQNVIESDHVLLFQDADITINIQVLQMLLPHVESDNSYDVTKDLLERRTLPIVLVSAVKRALNND